MNAVTEFRARLPMPQGLSDFDSRMWRVLCDTTFPTARSPEAIVMAFDYCKARGLDVFKKPVHIVPMWNSGLQREVETVWPGINEVQITAARTGAWAGMDEPKWGPDVEQTFKGRKKDKGGWKDAEAKVTFPEWCVVTVYRMVGGHPRAFAEPVYWLEAYSRAGGSELPTDMWVKRPRGQLHKVAKAASLRAAFPEEGELTAEEMEGKEIPAGGVVIEHQPDEGPKKRTREDIQAHAKHKRDETRERIPTDLAQIETLHALEKYKAEVLTPDFMATLGTAQYAVEEMVASREAELRAAQTGEVVDDSIEPEPTAKPNFIRHCHDIIMAAKTDKDLLNWWNAKDSKAARRQFELSPEEVQALMTRVMERRDELTKAPAVTV